VTLHQQARDILASPIPHDSYSHYAPTVRLHDAAQTYLDNDGHDDGYLIETMAWALAYDDAPQATFARDARCTPDEYFDEHRAYYMAQARSTWGMAV